MTDSELVPWGKGEKYPGQGSEIDLKPYAYNQSEHLYGVTACLLKYEPASCVTFGKVKFFLKNESEGKPSLNRAILVNVTRPETKWATHGQDEPVGNNRGGPN